MWHANSVLRYLESQNTAVDMMRIVAVLTTGLPGISEWKEGNLRADSTSLALEDRVGRIRKM